MSSRISQRIAAQTGIPQLSSVLEGLPASDLQSLLMEVYKARASRLDTSDPLARFERGGMLAPSAADARRLAEFDRIAFEVAEGFEALELSPVAPLGLSHVLGSIAQDHVLTAIRNAEVTGDCTTMLALECARRRRDARRRAEMAPLRLCASQRVLRLQPFDFPGYTPHFRLFCLVSSGRDTGSSAFEIQHLREHVRFYLKLLRALGARGWSLARPLVEISDLGFTGAVLASLGIGPDKVHESIRAHRVGGSEQFLAERGIELPRDVSDPAAELGEWSARYRLEPAVLRLSLWKREVVESLQESFPEAEFRFNLARLEGLGYYYGPALRISPVAPDGARYPIIDGGFTDWTMRLLQDRKERFLASGIGSEFACGRYRAVEP